MKIVRSLVILLCITAGFAQNGTQSKGKSLTYPKVSVFPITDTTLDREYELYIKLPEDYATDTDTTYPVLYYTDADWHVEMVSPATEYMLKGVILVGISWQRNIAPEMFEKVGPHYSRIRDFSLKPAEKPEIQKKYQMGQAPKHLAFIKKQVIPFIDQHYRTDTRSRTYLGYSMGGEFGAYALMTQPDTFDNYILGSPSIKNEIPELTRLNAAYLAQNPVKTHGVHANVFVTYGTQETEVTGPIDAFVKLLNDRRDNYLSVQKEVIEGDHTTAAPQTILQSVAWLGRILDYESGRNAPSYIFDVSLLNRPFISTSPAKRNDGLGVGVLGPDGGDPKAIHQLAQEIASGKHGVYDSFLVYQKDKLLFESYYNRGRLDLAHPQASATKVYTAFALGRAIQLGYLDMEDLHKPIASFLPELTPEKFVSGTELVTLHQALTMRSGIRIPEEQYDAMRENPGNIQGQQQVQAIFEQSAPITEASQSFNYGMDPILVMQVIEAVVPGGAANFIKTELLDKLGISNYEWKTSPSGLPYAPYRSSFRSRDMLKWGQLAANQGQWEGEQLIPKAYLEKAMDRQFLTGDDDIFGGGPSVSKQGYGYYWWTADLKVGDNTYYCQSAQGGGGQYVINIKELDLIIVVTGTDNTNKTLQLIADFVLPGFAR
ncbi:serine hydrolase [Sediminicola luteus]|uniref:Beta-lactamase-related domain-containing protein n=1 Tax=Sediminicola luteus TaxID=319238 RepID=A0A2A4G5R8_9FLAO|nr:serine hydrolase [Sediminicola luteus]PCE63773.1 hypothetical protein B7P33_10895 [Sediminicola luteus]